MLFEKKRTLLESDVFSKELCRLFQLLTFIKSDNR